MAGLTGERHGYTCRTCARDVRRYSGVTVVDERTGEFASVCGVCFKDRPTLALNALAAWLRGRPREVVKA